LIEKVWVVSATRETRWKTKSYRFHAFLMTPYVAIFALMIIFHIAELEADGTCIIGLRPVASIPLLVYDFVFNLYMTILFVMPLMQLGKSVRTDWKTSRLQNVARRTLIASIVSLLVSFANVLALAVLNGRERGVLCLTCCTVDVTINVITIHWVTSSGSSKITKEMHSSASSPNGNRTEIELENTDHLKTFSHFATFTYPQTDQCKEHEIDLESSIHESQSNSSRKSLTKKI
ncbi:hypothetical protein CU098_013627, partial [Rhizopus stolonifer]